MPLHVEREYALTRPSNTIEGLCEVQLYQVLPISHRPREGIHAVVLGPVKIRTLGVRDLDVWAFDGLTALETLVGQPDVALGIFDRLGLAGLDPNDLGGG